LKIFFLYDPVRVDVAIGSDGGEVGSAWANNFVAGLTNLHEVDVPDVNPLVITIDSASSVELLQKRINLHFGCPAVVSMEFAGFDLIAGMSVRIIGRLFCLFVVLYYQSH
jgi:hypothetical protein